MKKLLFALFATLLSACSGNDAIENTSVDNKETKYPVTFSVSNFTSEIQELRTADSSSDYDYLTHNGLKSFYLFIANEDSVFVEALEKTSLTDLSTLKNIEIKLPKGNYTAYSILLDNWDPKGQLWVPTSFYKGQKKKDSYNGFVASTEVITTYNYTLGGKLYTINHVNNFDFSQYDYFYKVTNFEVSEKGAEIKQILPRITGKLEFYFTDIKPLDNSIYPDSMYYAQVLLRQVKLGVTFDDIDSDKAYLPTQPGFYLTRKQWSELASKPLTFYLGNEDNAQLLIKIIDPTKPFQIPINVDKEYTISNIKVLRNRKTIMTGALDKTSGFSVDIDDAWGEDIKIDF